jgi:hypothetical protein
MKQRKWTEEEREQRHRLTIESGRNANLKPDSQLYPPWTPPQRALLGTIPDDEVGQLVG